MKTKLLFLFAWLMLAITGCSAGEPQTDLPSTSPVEKPEEPVKPGEMGFIKVKFNSENRPGEVHKSVTVTSNANPPFNDLLLKGTVIGKQ